MRIAPGVRIGRLTVCKTKAARTALPSTPDDAKEPPLQVWPDCRPWSVTEAGVNKRAIQEKTGYEEEDGNADLETRCVRTPKPASAAETTRKCSVREEHAHCGDRPQPIKAGKLAMTLRAGLKQRLGLPAHRVLAPLHSANRSRIVVVPTLSPTLGRL
jgi:hypothetical protein